MLLTFLLLFLNTQLQVTFLLMTLKDTSMLHLLIKFHWLIKLHDQPSKDLSLWTSPNRLALSSTKAQLIWFGTPQQLLNYIMLCLPTDFLISLFIEAFWTWESHWTVP